MPNFVPTLAASMPEDFTVSATVAYIWQHCIKPYTWIPRALWQSAFLCDHTNITPGEGKSYCPDCGEGVVYRWKLMRCSGCNARRDARYYLRRWLPASPFCPHCGEQRYTEEPLLNPKYHQLHKAYLSAIPAAKFEKEFAMPSATWVVVTPSFTRRPFAALPLKG